MTIIVAWQTMCVAQQGGPESRIGPLDAAIPPAEISISSGATPSVWKEESVVLMRSRVWLARGGRGIAGRENQIAKEDQDETSPAALRRKTRARKLPISKKGLGSSRKPREVPGNQGNFPK